MTLTAVEVEPMASWVGSSTACCLWTGFFKPERRINTLKAADQRRNNNLESKIPGDL